MEQSASLTATESPLAQINTSPTPTYTAQGKISVSTIIITTVLFLIILTCTPVITTVTTNQYDPTGTLLNGEEYTPKQSIMSGVYVLTHGQFGLLFGSISWYWFIGTLTLLYYLRKDALSKKVGCALLAFFCICLEGLYMFSPGSSNFSGSMSGATKITPFQHLGGYYTYIIFIAYFIIVTLLGMFLSAHSRINLYTKILSCLAVVAGLLISFYFSLPVYSKTFNTKSSSYSQNQIKETDNLNDYRENIISMFTENVEEMRTKSSYEALEFRRCDMDNFAQARSPDRKCLLTKIYTAYNYPPEDRNNTTYTLSNTIKNQLEKISIKLQEKQESLFGKKYPITYDVLNQYYSNQGMTSKAVTCTYVTELICN